jgi:hypothetical protein
MYSVACLNFSSRSVVIIYVRIFGWPGGCAHFAPSLGGLRDPPMRAGAHVGTSLATATSVPACMRPTRACALVGMVLAIAHIVPAGDPDQRSTSRAGMQAGTVKRAQTFSRPELRVVTQN